MTNDIPGTGVMVDAERIASDGYKLRATARRAARLGEIQAFPGPKDRNFPIDAAHNVGAQVLVIRERDGLGERQPRISVAHNAFEVIAPAVIRGGTFEKEPTELAELYVGRIAFPVGNAVGISTEV